MCFLCVWNVSRKWFLKTSLAENLWKYGYQKQSRCPEEEEESKYAGLRRASPRGKKLCNPCEQHLLWRFISYKLQK